MVVKGARALEVWARRVTAGYPHVDISNMTSSWKDGLAFCAILHRFRPDLIDFQALEPAQIERNCGLVFELAERELGIPALLDPTDMAECSSPDRLSILTYLAEFYHKFKNEEESTARRTKSSGGGPENSDGGRIIVELSRTDSCDSGVSISPVSSGYNSPPLAFSFLPSDSSVLDLESPDKSELVGKDKDPFVLTTPLKNSEEEITFCLNTESKENPSRESSESSDSPMTTFIPADLKTLNGMHSNSPLGNESNTTTRSEERSGEINPSDYILNCNQEAAGGGKYLESILQARILSGEKLQKGLVCRDEMTPQPTLTTTNHQSKAHPSKQIGPDGTGTIQTSPRTGNAQTGTRAGTAETSIQSSTAQTSTGDGKTPIIRRAPPFISKTDIFHTPNTDNIVSLEVNQGLNKSGPAFVVTPSRTMFYSEHKPAHLLRPSSFSSLPFLRSMCTPEETPFSSQDLNQPMQILDKDLLQPIEKFDMDIDQPIEIQNKNLHQPIKMQDKDLLQLIEKLDKDLHQPTEVQDKDLLQPLENLDKDLLQPIDNLNKVPVEAVKNVFIGPEGLVHQDVQHELKTSIVKIDDAVSVDETPGTVVESFPEHPVHSPGGVKLIFPVHPLHCKEEHKCVQEEVNGVNLLEGSVLDVILDLRRANQSCSPSSPGLLLGRALGESAFCSSADVGSCMNQAELSSLPRSLHKIDAIEENLVSDFNLNKEKSSGKENPSIICSSAGIVHSNLAHSTLVHNDPVHSNLAHSTLVHNDPVHSNLSHSTFVHCDPVHSTPVHTDKLFTKSAVQCVRNNMFKTKISIRSPSFKAIRDKFQRLSTETQVYPN